MPVATRRRSPALPANPTLPPLYFGYIRVSDPKTDEEAKLSLREQRETILDWISRNNAVAGPLYQDIWTGKDDDRPNYQALLADLAQQPAGLRKYGIVVANLDRLGRHARELITRREELQAAGAIVVAIKEGGELSNVHWNLLASIAQHHSERTSENITRVRSMLRAQGWWPPGRAPWGYTMATPTAEERAEGAPSTVLRIDKEVQPFARYAARLYADGASTRAVHAYLHSQPSAILRGRSFRPGMVRDWLHSRTIGGYLPDGNAGRWEPLIDAATYRALQDRATQQHEPYGDTRARSRWLLTGMLKCPRCGNPLHGWNPGGTRNVAPRYRCAMQAYNRDIPFHCSYSARLATIDALVLGDVAALCRQAEDVFTAERQRRADARTDTAHADPRTAAIAQLERLRDRATDDIAALGRLLARGDMTPAQYSPAVGAAEADLIKATTQLADLMAAPERDLPNLDTLIDDARQWPAILTHGTTAERKDLLRRLIDRVVPAVDHPRPGDVRFRWTPLGDFLAHLCAPATPATPTP